MTSFWIGAPRDHFSERCVQHFAEVDEIEQVKRKRMSGMFPISKRSQRAKQYSASANVSTAAMKRVRLVN